MGQSVSPSQASYSNLFLMLHTLQEKPAYLWSHRQGQTNIKHRGEQTDTLCSLIKKLILWACGIHTILHPIPHGRSCIENIK